MPVIIHKNHGDLYPFFVPVSRIFYRSDRLLQAIGNVEYIAYGMPLSAYLPYYQDASLSTRR